MGPVYYVISILGCADGSAHCAPAATIGGHYETRASCEAAEADALLESSDLDFPMLVARCTAVQVRPASTEEKRATPLVIALNG